MNRNIYLLGWLSFFNDFSSEMIAPLLPVYLASIGLGAGFLGLMEGFADGLSRITMLFSGAYTDRRGKTKRTTVWGYRLCAFIRPFMAFPLPAVVLAVRWLDRIGKGIRTSPRDRLITASVSPSLWGKAFGVQRMMDHAGSLIGAAAAALFLAFVSKNLSLLFVLASIPAVLSILLIPRFIRDVPVAKNPEPFALRLSLLPRPLRPFILFIFLSALSTPSELFLMLKMKDLGMPQYQMPLAWMFLTLFKLGSAYLGGILADRWSRRKTLALGWIVFVLVFLAFAWNTVLLFGWGLLALYGFHSGVVEPSERAYPATIATEKKKATAIGWYYFTSGLGVLPGSFLFGLFWKWWGSTEAFLIYAGFTLLILPLLFFVPSDRKIARDRGVSLEEEIG